MANTGTNSKSGKRRISPYTILVAGCLIGFVGFGIRSSFGLFLEPVTVFRGWDRETFALALAIQNLLWGAGVPIAGALADKYGPFRVISLGAILYGAGIYGMSIAESGNAFHLFAGLITGTGIAFTAFSLALAAMAKAVGPERRSFALGLGTAASSFGQVIFSPISQAAIVAIGWQQTLIMLALTCLVMIPLALALPKDDSASGSALADQTIADALREAMSHRGFILLGVGFFVCGFHVAFISVHFPAYILDLGMSAYVGAFAIALIGLFNIVGSFLSGAAGQKWSKRYGLSFIYFTRAIVITALLLAPKTETTIYAFSIAMGLLWLSTIPLTTGIVAQIFGVRYMATLFGIVFFSHQLGSFAGIWLGGYLYDTTGTYDAVWWAGAGLGVLAGIIHLPIDERPIVRQPA